MMLTHRTVNLPLDCYTDTQTRTGLETKTHDDLPPDTFF